MPLHVKVNGAELRDALTRFSRVVPAKPTIPILSHVGLQARYGKLRLTGTNLDQWVEEEITAEAADMGECAVRLDRLLAAIGGFGGEVSLRLPQSRLHVEAGSSDFTLSTLPFGDVPALPEENRPAAVDIPAASLRTLLASVADTMGDDTAKIFLCGALLHVEDGLLKAATTNGVALSANGFACEAAVGMAGGGVEGVLVPSPAVRDLIKRCGGVEALRAGWTDRHFTVETDAWRYTTRLVDAKFVDYKRVIPGKSDLGALICSAKDLLDGAQHVATVAEVKAGGVRGIRLTFGGEDQGGTLRITAQGEGDEGKEVITCTWGRKPVECGFDVAHLRTVLGDISGDVTLLFNMDTPGAKPVRVEDPARADLIRVINPRAV